MNITSAVKTAAVATGRKKFDNPDTTAAGQRRAAVDLRRLDTLWINTGTLCNIACDGCYIESSPRNDALSYIRASEVAAYLDEIERDGLGTREIGFTGGEPFMNPDFMWMLHDALARGFEVLILTNAMKPMLNHRAALSPLIRRYGRRLRIRVSIDHYSAKMHEVLRGPRTWAPMLQGLRWLAGQGAELSVAGRTVWQESEAGLRAGFAAFFEKEEIPVEADDPHGLVLFPEMDAAADVPEISSACWNILGKDPGGTMCASSRMVVKRKGADRPAVVACTLLPYDKQFELGETLAEAAKRVKLNHPHCAQFCVLGGASCTG